MNMKNIALITTILFVGSISFAADMYCVAITNNNPAEQISKDLKFSGAYLENIELMENADFEVTIHATGGHFFGISVYDKVADSVLTTEGRRLSLSKLSGIESFEKLRILCL